MKTLSILLFGIFVLSCSSARENKTDSKQHKTRNFVKIGNQKWMEENLKDTPDGLNTLCYKNEQLNCQEKGVLYNWKDMDALCPEGWHLPTTSDILGFLEQLPGETNANNGKIINKKTLEMLNLGLGGINIKRGESRIFFGKGRQEMWLTASDSVWVDPKDSDKKLRLIGLHFYPIGKDSINVEPSFSDNPDDTYAYCRCIKS